MLKGISPLLSPDLLAVLCRMGHGDEIVLADAHFPAHSVNSLVIRADGLRIPDLLAAILPLFELDSYVSNPVVMMAAVKGDELNMTVEKSYMDEINQFYPLIMKPERIERFDFYERAKSAFAVVVQAKQPNTAI